MAVLTNVTKYNSSLFTHIKNAKILIAEASTLNFTRVDRLYDDAMDVGIALFNQKTGNVTHWYLEDLMHAGLGDDIEIVGWQFRPTRETVHKNPTTEGYVLQIEND